MLELLMSLLENPHLQLSLFAYVIVYGIAFGVKNFINRVVALFKNKKVHQLLPGRIFDSLWITSVVLLIIANYQEINNGN